MPSPEVAPALSVEIHIDAEQSRGPLHRSEKYINTSLRHAPPPELMQKASDHFGRFRMARIFLTLDEYWDYRDGSYHPNYRIGRDRYADDAVIHKYDRGRSKESRVNYLDYLDGVAAEADILLLCVRRYEHEVTRGIISREKYEEVLHHGVRMIKQRHPSLRYLEVLNESSNDHFGGLDAKTYYEFYRSFYRVANAINAEKPGGPEIGVGGPVTDKSRFQLVESFLQNYRADSNGGKRLDFISYHDYASGDRPVRVAELRNQLDQYLKAAGLPPNIPAFITEMGTHEGKAGGNACMAAGVPALFEQVRKLHDVTAFPWCIYHDPEIQLWSTQHLPDGRMTPHGMAMALLGLQRTNELTVTSDGVDANGLGVYALASRDEGGLCFHVWNYSKVSADVRITISHLPDAGSKAEAESYLLDSRHNNILRDADHPGTLQGTKIAASQLNAGLSIMLEPYAHALWLVKTAAKK